MLTANLPARVLGRNDTTCDRCRLPRCCAVLQLEEDASVVNVCAGCRPAFDAELLAELSGTCAWCGQVSHDRRWTKDPTADDGPELVCQPCRCAEHHRLLDGIYAFELEVVL